MMCRWRDFEWRPRKTWHCPDIITALNVTTANNASTLGNISDTALTALTVDGSKVLTLTSTAGATSLSTVTVKGTAGLTATVSQASVTAVDTSATTGAATITLDATKASYTGGAGVDKVSTSAAAPSKAISLGDGDDMLTLWTGTTAVTGTITGGNGTDTLSMVAADAVTASATATFAGKVSGFEKLVLTGGGTNIVNVATLGNYTDVSTAGDTLLTLGGVTSGSTLRLTATGTAQTVSSTAATLAGSADVLNVAVTGITTAGDVNFSTTGLTATDIETIAITSNYDSSMTTANQTTAMTGSWANQIVLLGNQVKTITVGGAAGFNLTAASTAVTSMDASGLTVGATGEFSWTSGALAAAATVKGAASAINTISLAAATEAVTYTGSSGTDSVVLAATAKANTLTLGNGTNTVTGATTGNNTITGGTGADTFTTATTGNNTISFGDGANAFTATTGNNTYTGGSGVDTVTVGGGQNTITTGTGADVITFTAAPASVNVYSTITDAHKGESINFPNLGTETFTTTKVTLLATAVFQDYANAVVAAGGNATANAAGGWFQFNGDTYFVQSQHNGTTTPSFVNGTDYIVKLTGLIDLSTATVTGANGILIP